MKLGLPKVDVFVFEKAANSTVLLKRFQLSVPDPTHENNSRRVESVKMFKILTELLEVITC